MIIIDKLKLKHNKQDNYAITLTNEDKDKTYTKYGILNIIFEEKVESTLINPTFITEYPKEISPLAKNKKGYQNLVKLVSIAHIEGFYYKPRINFELLQK